MPILSGEEKRLTELEVVLIGTALLVSAFSMFVLSVVWLWALLYADGRFFIDIVAHGEGWVEFVAFVSVSGASIAGSLVLFRDRRWGRT